MPELGTLARVPLFLTYDNGYAPIHWNLVRQEEGDNLPSLEELEEGGEPPPLEDGPPEDLRPPVHKLYAHHSTGVPRS